MSERLRCRGFFLTEQTAVDGDVIRNVVILGPESSNGNTYTLDAMRSAVPFYEGRGVYVDHDVKAKARKVAERFGHVSNPRLVESDHDGKPRVRGDLHFQRTHPAAPGILEAITKGNGYFGLSHVADGLGRKDGKRRVVEQITSVQSIDLVDRAATGTLVEQEEPEGDEAAPMPMDPMQQMKDGLIQMVAAIINDDSMDAAAKKEKIAALIDAHDSTTPEGGGGAPPVPEPAGEPMSEQARSDYQKRLASWFGGLVEQKQKPQTDAVAALTAQVAGLAQVVQTLVEQGNKPRKYLPPRTPGEPPAVTARPVNGVAPPKNKEERKRFLQTP